MEQTLHSPRRLFLIGLSAVAVLIALVALVSFVLVTVRGHGVAVSVSNKPAVSHVATETEIKQSLRDLDSSLKQSAKDQSASRTVINENHVKVDI